jgi:hypothetical protein
MLNSFAKAPRQQASQTVTVAAPIGGWNARDALGAMDPLDAVTLQNFWPGTNSVILRNGYTKHATGFPSTVESLMPYSSGTANKLFAVSDGKIYEATNPGAIGAAAVSGLSNSRFQYTNITTAGGSYLMAVNGADKLQIFDGTNWHEDGDGPPYDITNVDTADCSNILLFKNRIWLIENGSLKVWYLPINAIGGAAVALDMTTLVQLGGYIMAGMTWTLDAGYGVDDNLAFITNKGELSPLAINRSNHASRHINGWFVEVRRTDWSAMLYKVWRGFADHHTGWHCSHVWVRCKAQGLTQGCQLPTKFSMRLAKRSVCTVIILGGVCCITPKKINCS